MIKLTTEQRQDQKRSFICINGPLAGNSILIARHSDGKTAVFSVGADRGHYIRHDVDHAIWVVLL